MSLGIGSVIDYCFFPARNHDSKHLVIDEKWNGRGLIADLAYASFATFKSCIEHNVQYVFRLKKGWRPKVSEINRGTVKKVLIGAKEFDLVIDESIVLDGKVIDLTATLEKDGEVTPVRIVGVCGKDNGYNFFLTSLPRSTGPRQINDLYRCRWKIEMDNKTNKSCFSLDEIQSYTPHALHVMLHAAMIGSMIASLLAHEHNLENIPESPGVKVPVRDYPPLHPKLIAGYLSTASQSVGAALFLEGEAAEAEWERICLLILRLGKDTNWRSRPSILDQLRGWPKSQKASV